MIPHLSTDAQRLSIGTMLCPKHDPEYGHLLSQDDHRRAIAGYSFSPVGKKKTPPKRDPSAWGDRL
jgi:hypothetical protein